MTVDADGYCPDTSQTGLGAHKPAECPTCHRTVRTLTSGRLRRHAPKPTPTGRQAEPTKAGPA